ncbi:MAG: phosphatase PAP2-related protein [Planctomycetota bacterium]|mgnify:CR=1 FL=1|nr:phosphatase PAP2-related protein [Planctomycetota bacterium]
MSASTDVLIPSEATRKSAIFDAASPTLSRRSWRALAPSIAGALAFRFACYAAMTALALWSETQRGPVLHDALVSRLPYVPWIDRVNYVAWLVVYLPLTLVFLWSEPRRWVRYMITGGLVSLARGVCIAVTTLGVPDPDHAGAGLGERNLSAAFLDLLSPVGVFSDGSARAYLTQDLFFSGHAATTFLLVLYLWRRPRWRWIALVAHVAMVAAVMLAHLHYTIDILGAWAFTFALFAAREWSPRASIAMAS